MKGLESAPLVEGGSEFDLPAGDSFDVNAAFQQAIQGVASSEELALDEKVRRMETIVAEGASELYREFVDFRAMAAQMEMLCRHDHTLNESIQSSEALSGFMNSYKSSRSEDQDETARPGRQGHKASGFGKPMRSMKAKKKSKKPEWRGWLNFLMEKK